LYQDCNLCNPIIFNENRVSFDFLSSRASYFTVALIGELAHSYGQVLSAYDIVLLWFCVESIRSACSSSFTVFLLYLNDIVIYVLALVI
jgi:hypothetical protein